MFDPLQSSVLTARLPRANRRTATPRRSAAWMRRVCASTRAVPWQGDDHPAAVGTSTLGVDGAAVQLDDRAGDRQAEPGAAVARSVRCRRGRSARRSGRPSPSGMPGPSSQTSSSTAAASWRAPTATRPPSGEWRIALSSRLATTCWMRSGSPLASARRARRSARPAPTARLGGECRSGPRAPRPRAAARRANRRSSSGSVTRLEPGEVEQLRHQPPEAVDLGEHRLQRRRVGRLDAVDDVLQHRVQRADRRAQLVRRRWRSARGARVSTSASSAAMRLNASRQLAHLVAGGRLDPAVVAALGHVARRPRPSRAAGRSSRVRGTGPSASAMPRRRARRTARAAARCSRPRQHEDTRVTTTAATITTPSLGLIDGMRVERAPHAGLRRA